MENKIETRCLSGKFKYFKQSRVTTDTIAIPILIIGYTIGMIKIKNFHYLYTINILFLKMIKRRHELLGSRFLQTFIVVL